MADAVIAGMMLVHAGAVLQLDSSTARQVAQVKAAAEAQAKLREADATVEAAKIKAAGEAAAAVKRETGSTTLATRTLKTAETKQDGRAAEALTKMAGEVQPKTFLSDDYMQGGVYYWPALVALFFFVVAIGISGFSVRFEDANENGIPDAAGNFFGRFHSAPADQTVTAQPQIAEPPQPKPTVVWRGGPDHSDFIPNFLGRTKSKVLALSHSAGDPADDLPIGSRPADWLNHFSHALDCRSAFINVPSFSKEETAGRKTVPNSLAVSFKNRSCRITSSRFPKACRVRCALALDNRMS